MLTRLFVVRLCGRFTRIGIVWMIVVNHDRCPRYTKEEKSNDTDSDNILNLVQHFDCRYDVVEIYRFAHTKSMLPS